MCSFCSCQTRFEFLSQFRKVRNAFECFVTQVQTRLPKTKCVWPMKINVICTVYTHGQTASGGERGHKTFHRTVDADTKKCIDVFMVNIPNLSRYIHSND